MKLKDIKTAIKEMNFALLIANALALVAKLGHRLGIDQVKKYYGLHITTKHTGKMEGMLSLSTNMLLNAFCKAHRNTPGAICQHCYANNLLTFRPSMQKPYTFNTYLLKNCILPLEILPVINANIFRFESFGDLDNVNQAINYINICKVNPNTTFALWTKNPIIMKRALKIVDKPENLIIIYSSLYINDRTNGLKMMKIYPWIDKVFTVYDEETIESKGIEINCGPRHCLSCQRCYSKSTEKFINEKLK